MFPSGNVVVAGREIQLIFVFGDYFGRPRVWFVTFRFRISAPVSYATMIERSAPFR